MTIYRVPEYTPFGNDLAPPEELSMSNDPATGLWLRFDMDDDEVIGRDLITLSASFTIREALSHRRLQTIAVQISRRELRDSPFDLIEVGRHRLKDDLRRIRGNAVAALSNPGPAWYRDPWSRYRERERGLDVDALRYALGSDLNAYNYQYLDVYPEFGQHNFDDLDADDELLGARPEDYPDLYALAVALGFFAEDGPIVGYVRGHYLHEEIDR